MNDENKEHPQEDKEAKTPEGAEEKKGFPIVGIGASAGGLSAFEAFFSGMPAGADPGMAFVLVQHLAPDHKSILTELIRRYTRMQVLEVRDGMKVEPNCAYIIPPGRDMAFIGGNLQLLEPSAPRGQRLPIDFFFRSLAQDLRERAIGIVLSGTGSDGTLGIRAIKGEGGMVMAQAPATTEYDGMPRSAIATGLVDYELPPAEMAAQLIAYASRAFGKTSARGPSPEIRSENALKKIFILVRSQTGHDFSQYKINTIHRRIERRMAVHQIETMDAYVKFMQRTPSETEALFRDLLIGVTSFFRDPEAFKLLEEKIIPKLFAGKTPESVIRVWSPGCATGEEAYSLAILLAEHQEALKRAFRIQVFATDIDVAAVAHARSGIYAASVAADISPERLARFFSAEPEGASYRIHKMIRDMLIFSEQDVIRDPPFSRIDLISCRNMLIYMDAELQKKLIPLFHYALNPGGFLFLGTSETISEFTDLFNVIDRKQKVYQRKEDLRGSQRQALGRFLAAMNADTETVRGKTAASGKLPLRELTEQALLQQTVPAAALVSARGDILYLHGRTGQFLEPAQGEAGVSNILKMAREGLKRDLATSLHKAATDGKAVRHSNLKVKTNGDFESVNLTVRPVAIGAADGAEAPLFLVILEHAQPPEPPPVTVPDAEGTDTDARVVALQQELKAKEDHLQSTNEQLETANEELKSSNEEMQSVNEELQSTNEELETSKEELQSVNEELATVNAELQTKVTDLTRANNDMNNLLAGTGIGTVFVDHALKILRFTPAATRIINLIQSDVGRPVGHIVSNLADYSHLPEDAKEVLETLVPKEVEVRTGTGAWYEMRIMPYRTLDNVIEGAVITFVDITALKQAQEALGKSESLYRALVLASSDAVYRMGPDWSEMRYLQSRDFIPVTNSPSPNWLHRYIPPEEQPRVRAKIEEAVRTKGIFELEHRVLRVDGSVGWTFSRAVPLLNKEGDIVEWVGTAIDISDRKTAQERLAADLGAMKLQSEVGAVFVHEGDLQPVLDKIVETAVAIAGADMGNIQLLNPASGALEVRAQRGSGRRWTELCDGAGRENDACGSIIPRGTRMVVEDVAAEPLPEGAPAEIMRGAGIRALVSTPVKERAGRVIGVFSVFFRSPHKSEEGTLQRLDVLARLTADVIERARTDDELKRSEEKYRTLAGDGTVGMEERKDNE
ncbi:MAG TPA: chemotaxis protein CheB [Syntrophorhabdaceae bacterium]|jgi:two-component system CheB/CheR fusion protein